MMNVFRRAQVWTLAAMALTVGMPAFGQQPTPTPTGLPQQQPIDRYVVGQARPPAEPGHTLVDMTLEQAMTMALEKNLDLKVARMDPQSIDYQLQSARAGYMARYTSSYSYQNNTRPATQLTQGVDRLTDGVQNFNANASQALPWYGASWTAAFTNSRQVTNNRDARLNPTLNSALRFTYNQPLLAGFKIDSTRNSLRTLGIQRQIADVTLVSTIENTKASVRTAYWSLRQAIEQIEIQQRNLQLAQRLYQDNRIKVEIGTLAPIDTTQPEAAVASAEQTLLAAQIAWQQAELALKRLLVSGPDDELNRSTVNINPTEQAVLTPQVVDIPAAVKNAIANRADMVQSRKNLEISNLNLEVSKNQTKPQLDLSAGYNTSGQGGNRLVNNEIVSQGGYIDALRTLRSLDTAGFNMALNFTLPIGRDVNVSRANHARGLLQLEQAQQRLKAQELTVSVQVTNAGLAVDNTAKQFQAAQKSREASERNAEAEQTRFDVGMSTNYNVVQAQNALTLSRLSELRNLINYLNAVAEFDRVQKVGGGGGGN
jgi:outer membrane protein TolC